MGDKIIITAPLPPPIHGMSLATFMLLKGISSDFEPTLIDTAMDKNLIVLKQPSVFAPKRLSQIIFRLFRDSNRMLATSYKLHYLCSGLDFRGIVRYLPYVMISKFKNKPYIIHVHNGAFRRMYDTLTGNKKRIIDYIFKGASGVIVLGESLKPMFSGVVANEKIFVVANCVADNCFATSKQIEEKITKERKIHKILYLSNLMQDKGIFELMDAVDNLENCELHLAGAIEQSEQTKTVINKMLEKNKGKFFYHGIVSGNAKKELLVECDIFVLPSRNEGQPISILEAYANGLAVVTDPTVGGICDIFENGVNGVACTSTDVMSIRTAIKQSIANINNFIEPNYNYAISRFKTKDFTTNIEHIFSEILHK